MLKMYEFIGSTLNFMKYFIMKNYKNKNNLYIIDHRNNISSTEHMYLFSVACFLSVCFKFLEGYISFYVIVSGIKE